MILIQDCVVGTLLLLFIVYPTTAWTTESKEMSATVSARAKTNGYNQCHMLYALIDKLVNTN